MKVCSVDGCNLKYRCKGYCDAHYRQIMRHGKILKRTRYDPNKIILHEDYAEIELYNMQCKPIAYAKIDLDDVEKCRDYKWTLCNGYAKKIYKGKNLNLSDYLMNFKGNHKIVIDHKNHDKLDNRKQNLRIATQSQNV